MFASARAGVGVAYVLHDENGLVVARFLVCLGKLLTGVFHHRFGVVPTGIARARFVRAKRDEMISADLFVRVTVSEFMLKLLYHRLRIVFVTPEIVITHRNNKLRFLGDICVDNLFCRRKVGVRAAVGDIPRKQHCVHAVVFLRVRIGVHLREHIAETHFRHLRIGIVRANVHIARHDETERGNKVRRFGRRTFHVGRLLGRRRRFFRFLCTTDKNTQRRNRRQCDKQCFFQSSHLTTSLRQIATSKRAFSSAQIRRNAVVFLIFIITNPLWQVLV